MPPITTMRSPASGSSGSSSDSSSGCSSDSGGSCSSSLRRLRQWRLSRALPAQRRPPRFSREGRGETPVELFDVEAQAAGHLLQEDPFGRPHAAVSSHQLHQSVVERPASVEPAGNSARKRLSSASTSILRCRPRRKAPAPDHGRALAGRAGPWRPLANSASHARDDAVGARQVAQQSEQQHLDGHLLPRFQLAAVNSSPGAAPRLCSMPASPVHSWSPLRRGDGGILRLRRASSERGAAGYTSRP